MGNRIPRSIRFEEDDLQMLTETAKSIGLDFAPFIRMAAMEAAKRVNENKVSEKE